MRNPLLATALIQAEAKRTFSDHPIQERITLFFIRHSH